jgi:hypothetical protein
MKSQSKRKMPFKSCALIIIKDQIDPRMLEVPEVKLVWHVITSTYQEALSKDRSLREEARRYLLDGYLGFLCWCEMLGLEFEWVRALLHKEISD